jgi:hypothetical protein
LHGSVNAQKQLMPGKAGQTTSEGNKIWTMSTDASCKYFLFALLILLGYSSISSEFHVFIYS